MYPREPRGIGPFLPRVPPAQTPIGSLMPQAHSPYNLSPHGSQGLGSVTGVSRNIIRNNAIDFLIIRFRYEWKK